MVKKFLAVAITAGTLLLMPPADAAVQTYTGEGTYIMSEGESLGVAKERAKTDAMRAATEKAGVYIRSYSKLKNLAIVDDEVYNKAIQLNPDYVYAYNGRGNVLDDMGRYDEAIASYNKAIQLDPNYTYPYNGRGVSYYNKGDYRSAIDSYTQAIALNPNYIQAYTNRGTCYEVMGNIAAAQADYAKARSLGARD